MPLLMIGVVATVALTALAMAGYLAIAMSLSLALGIVLGVATHASIRGH